MTKNNFTRNINHKNQDETVQLPLKFSTFTPLYFLKKILIFTLFINLVSCSQKDNSQDQKLINDFFQGHAIDLNSNKTNIHDTPFTHSQADFSHQEDLAHKSMDGKTLLFIRNMMNMDLYSDTFSANLTGHRKNKRPNLVNNPFYQAVSPQIALILRSKNKTFNEKIILAFPKSFIKALENLHNLKKAPSLITSLAPTSYNIENKPPRFVTYEAKEAKDSYQYTIPVRTSNNQVYISQPVIVYLGTSLPYTSFKELPENKTFSYKNTSYAHHINKTSAYGAVQFDAYNGNPLTAFIRLNEDNNSSYTVTIHNNENPKGDVSYKRSLKKGVLEILGLYYNDITKVTLQKDSEKPKTLLFDTRDYKPTPQVLKFIKNFQESSTLKLTKDSDYQKFFILGVQTGRDNEKSTYNTFGIDVNGKIRFYYLKDHSQIARLFKKTNKLIVENGETFNLNGVKGHLQNLADDTIHHDIIHIPEKHSYIFTLHNGITESDIIKVKDNMSLSSYDRTSAETFLPRNIFTPELFIPYEDFYHINALSYNKCSNLLAISLRALNTVAFVDYDTFQLKYLLADKRAINPDYYKYLLKNTGNNKDILSGQHAVQFLNCHQILLFDNGIARAVRNPEGKNHSSLDLYHMDFKNRSFKLEKQWKSKTFSSIVSYVDHDPKTEQFFMEEGSTTPQKVLRMLDKDMKKEVWHLKINNLKTNDKPSLTLIYRAFPFNLK